MSWSECCGSVIAFNAACQRHIMVQYCCGSVAQTRYLVDASYFDRNPMKRF